MPKFCQIYISEVNHAPIFRVLIKYFLNKYALLIFLKILLGNCVYFLIGANHYLIYSALNTILLPKCSLCLKPQKGSCKMLWIKKIHYSLMRKEITYSHYNHDSSCIILSIISAFVPDEKLPRNASNFANIFGLKNTLSFWTM